MSAMAVVLVVLAVAGIAAIRHADRRAERMATRRQISQTVRMPNDKAK
jgi:hypothetical protein